MSEQEWNQARLQALIDNRKSEGLYLEYKGAGSLIPKNTPNAEITKDVSAFANADGGVLIYGIKETQKTKGNSLPEKIEPIDSTQPLWEKVNKEWLQQMISQIVPRINGIIIHTVFIDDSPNLFVLVVEIPAGLTAHQAIDGKYYQRLNALVEPMTHYQIEDVKRRNQAPRLIVECSVGMGRFFCLTYYNLVINVKNEGQKKANDIIIESLIPRNLLTFYHKPFAKPSELIDGIEYVRVKKSNEKSKNLNLEDKTIPIPSVEPILPGRSLPLEVIISKDWYKFPDSSVKWYLFTDESGPQHGEVFIKDLALSEPLPALSLGQKLLYGTVIIAYLSLMAYGIRSMVNLFLDPTAMFSFPP